VNIVFDFGGVLFDWQPQAFTARLLPDRASTAHAAQALVVAFVQGHGGDWGEFDRGTIAAALLAGRIAWRTGLALADVSCQS
jgi:putative hydrolase of the HAD superfamily